MTRGVVWARGAASTIGSWPGTDPRQPSAIVAGETPLLPALPELPGRGAGADMIGRTAAMLDGIAVETVPSGWRVTAAPGPDQRRARSWLREDLDVFEEAVHGIDAPMKIQICGPITLMAGIELASGESALRDHGARRDIAAALAEAVVAHALDVRRRLDRAASLVVQIDEPGLPAVLSGSVRTASGLQTYRAVDRAEVDGALQRVIGALHDIDAVVAMHCCAADSPWSLFSRAGADVLAVDLATTSSADYEPIAEHVDGGGGILLGIVPATRPPAVPLRDTVASTRRWWRDLGLPSGALSTAAFTPACGMAGAGTSEAGRRIIERCVAVATAVLEDPDGDHWSDS